jgi:biotin synthase
VPNLLRHKVPLGAARSIGVHPAGDRKMRLRSARELRLTTPVIDGSFVPAWSELTARGKAQDALHQRAARCTAQRFGAKVFVRGVVEISNYCRENCTYCGMRRSNRSLSRFRVALDQISELLLQNRPASITDINIQAGEDPVAVREVAIPLVKLLRTETNLGLSVCLGTLKPDIYAELKRAGASIYIIKFEMADSGLYRRMQAPGSLAERLEHIRHLAATGWNVSSGFIAGLPGETKDSLLDNFQLAAQLPLDGCSVSPFIPGEETPLRDIPPANIDLTLNCMAALRLMRPDWIIPAVSALNLAEPGAGYGRGLRAGANLVTINLTPSDIRSNYLLYKRERFIMTEERILSAMAAEGLSASTQSLAEHYQARRSTGHVEKFLASNAA